MTKKDTQKKLSFLEVEIAVGGDVGLGQETEVAQNSVLELWWQDVLILSGSIIHQWQP